MASKTMKSKEEMTLTDQKKINAFANANAALHDVQEEATARKKEIQDLGDASDDVMLLDDEERVPYQLGEVFINIEQDEAQSMMEVAKAAAESRLKELLQQAEELSGTMKKLKVELYAKFGDNINLEADE